MGTVNAFNQVRQLIQCFIEKSDVTAFKTSDTLNYSQSKLILCIFTAENLHYFCCFLIYIIPFVDSFPDLLSLILASVYYCQCKLNTSPTLTCCLYTTKGALRRVQISPRCVWYDRFFKV